MAKKKEVISVENDLAENVLIVNGRKYIVDRVASKKIDGVIHNNKIIYKEVNKDEIKKDIDTVVDALKNQTSTGELIRELLKGYPTKDLRRIAKRIRLKLPIKKQHGCLGFKIGDSYLQLID